MPICWCGCPGLIDFIALAERGFFAYGWRCPRAHLSKNMS